MKLILLAATAMLAAPVMAQTTPAPADAQTTPAPADPAMTPAPTDPAAAPADPAAQAPMPQQGAAPMPQAGTPAPMSTGAMNGATPAGGYAPSAPAISGGTPGSNLPPVFRPAPTPDQAYPAPAPMAKYPICKKGQYDHCMQRGGK